MQRLYITEFLEKYLPLFKVIEMKALSEAMHDQKLPCVYLDPRKKKLTNFPKLQSRLACS